MRVPPYHWWRTVFYLIPAIAIYTIVLGAASIVSSVFDRRGYSRSNIIAVSNEELALHKEFPTPLN